MDNKQKTAYTAKDFLEKYLEFVSLVSYAGNWKLEKLKEKKRFYYRLKELLALMKAFNIGKDLQTDFKELKFLEKRKESDFKILMEDMKKYSNKFEIEKEEYKSFENNEYTYKLIWFEEIFLEFLRFLEYTQRALLLYNYDDYLIGDFIGIRYATTKTGDLRNKLINQMSEIKDIFAAIIDPKNQIITRERLIKEYGFPDIDIKGLDIEERMRKFDKELDEF